MKEKYKNEYFSNIYINLFTNQYFHIIITIIEYAINLILQLDVISSSFKQISYNPIAILNFSSTLTMTFKSISIIFKLFFFIIMKIIIISYYFILKTKRYKQNILLNIFINFFEIFLFRLLMVFYFSIIFSFNIMLLLILSVILTLFILIIIIQNFMNNHLFYFVPDFMVFPYDSYSSITDSFNLIIKFLLALTL